MGGCKFIALAHFLIYYIYLFYKISITGKTRKISSYKHLTTNFDLVLERTAGVLDIDVSVFSAEADFPDRILPSQPLPIYKLQGSSKTGATPVEPAADIFEIGREQTSLRGRTLERYLKGHNILVLGYGGTDY